jgi:hypothetical protein
MRAIPMFPRAGSRDAMVFRFVATNILDSELLWSKVRWNLGDVDMECVSGIPTKGLCQSVTPASDSWSPRTETTKEESKATIKGRIVLSIARRTPISWRVSPHWRGRNIKAWVFGSVGVESQLSVVPTPRLFLSALPMKEIIHIQAGNVSNHIGTHFFNTLESYFSYQGDDRHLDIDHNVSFREGEAPNGDPTFCPRLMLFDYKRML